MSALPPPSRQVLADLGGTYPVLRPMAGPNASSVQRALAEVISLLNVQAMTSAMRDRIEAAFLQHRRVVRSSKLVKVEAHEHSLATRIDEASVNLLLAPITGLADLSIKVGVLIALSEAGPADRADYLSAYLRVLLADIDQCSRMD